MKIVMFSQTWCGPCRQLKPHLEAAAKQLGYDVNVVELDKVDNADELIDEYNIGYTPTVIIEHDDALGGVSYLATTNPHIGPPNALAIKAELEQYV
jgi:thiol-disulfide isomerase/thioredoxin